MGVTIDYLGTSKKPRKDSGAQNQSSQRKQILRLDTSFLIATA